MRFRRPVSFIVSVAAALFVLARGAKAGVDLGKLDKDKAETASVPKSDDGVSKVGIRTDVTGETKKDEKRTVYILVCPISNKDTSDWWVQEAASITGEKFNGSCQFGEGSTGVGEYFAVVAIATDKKYNAGERLAGIPEGQTYTKTVVVKRSN